MSPHAPPPLPRFDCTLLRAVEQIVPIAARADWLRTWQAELWHTHHRRSHDRRARTFSVAADLSLGLACDALWLRAESWRVAFGGTAVLCLATLAALCVFSSVLTLAMGGGWGPMWPHLAEQLQHFVFAAPLVTFVSFGTASHRQAAERTAGRAIYRIRRGLFLAAKSALALLLCFLLSVDVCLPLHAFLPNTADLLQILFFVIFALIALRWVFADQEQRCQQCLRALASPARVGRPTYNLLEWNGTEQVCKQGHGLLSVPEMESSWRQSSQWVELAAGWDQPASV
jgi:hypothetical protein